MIDEKNIVTSGSEELDRLLGGGIIIGDNVIWYDDAGSLAPVFSLNLICSSKKHKKSIIYVSFDRSPKNLLEYLGEQANNPYLTILDCFTHGKGEGSDIFLDFYDDKSFQPPCQIVKVEEPKNADHVMGAFYGLHKTMKGDVRFIFESLTGMQELWGREDSILKFYSHSCPRLYELNTVAYWMVEKEAHSQQLKAHLNKITQVAIDLSLKRGKTFLTVIKAEKRDLNILNKQTNYWAKGLEVTFETEKRGSGQFDLGNRLKELRIQKGLSQTELAKHVGVTPSTISQVESNQIYPSLPALIKMAEILSAELSSFFTEPGDHANQVVFTESDAVPVSFPNLPKDSIYPKLLTPVGFDAKTEHYLIEIPPHTKLNGHFFIHKGEEVGYLASGQLNVTIENRTQTVHAGDMICFTTQIPSQWENAGEEMARLFWVKVK
jgi:transcriptional regulator with XRE-family HTH domain/KaiC/GvpD/RAD55 family RecA-like ATPase